ncbi:hypothetical protein CRG98_013248, partial [Punica granatum]
MAYVEGNLDWMWETCLDITRELDRSDGYSGNQPVLLQIVVSGDSISRVSVARPREGGHSQAALHRLRTCVPRRDKIRVRTRIVSSPSLLARAFCKSYRAYSPMHSLTFALQVRRACSLVLLANLSNLLARAQSLLRIVSLPSLLARVPSLLHFSSSSSLLASASCTSARTARPCTLSFMLRKFTEPARSCFLPICQACSPVHTLFYASQFRGASSLVLLANMLGLLARAHSLLRFASSLSFLARASCKSAGQLDRADSLLCFACSASLLARASCQFVGPARPCTLSFTLRNFAEPARYSPSLLARAFYKSAGLDRPCTLSLSLCNFAEPARSCFMQICRDYLPVHTLLCFLSLLALASCKFAGTAPPCTLSFMLRKFAEPSHLCLLHICRACSTVHSLLRFAISPSLPDRASCKSVEPARPCTLSFVLRKLAEPVRSYIFQIYRAATPCSLFYASLANSPSLLARGSCKSVATARPCTISFTHRKFAKPTPTCTLSFMLRKFTEPSHSSFLHICRACSTVHTLFYASQVCQACSLVFLANLPSLLARAHSLLSFASWPSLFGRPSRKTARLLPRALSFTHLKIAELPRSCFLQILPGLLAHALSLFRFAISLNLLARASCKSTRTARSCTLSLMLRKFAEPSHSCFLHICQACSTMHTLIYALTFRRACSIVLLANLSNLLARAHSLLSFTSWPSLFGCASRKSAGLLPRALSFTHRKFAEPSHSCFLHICQACSTMHTLIYALTFRRACSIVLLANLSNLLARAHSLLCFASSPSFLARAFCKSAGPGRPCTLPLSLCNFAEASHSCFLHICQACSTMHTLIYALTFRRACSIVLLANLSNLLARAHSLLCFASSPSFLARAFCKSAGPGRPCTLPLSLCNFAEPARSCFMQIRRDCPP